MVPATFITELEKTAISMGRTLAAVQRRVGQGAMVAPGMLKELEAGAAKGISSTPRAARRTALYAAEGGRDAARVQQMTNNPVTNAARERLNAGSAAARSSRPGVHDTTRPLADHYDHGPNPNAGFGYSRQHMDAMAGASQIHDPKGLMVNSDRVGAALNNTVATSSGAGGATAVSRPSALRARPTTGTAITQVSSPNLAQARPNTAITRIGNDSNPRALLQRGQGMVA